MQDYVIDDNVFSDKRRTEMIDGKIYLMASPSDEHVNIQENLYNIFNDYFRKGNKKCIVKFTKDLYINRKNWLTPDLLIYCRNNNEKKNKNVPLIVVEILSESTWKRDVTVKMKKYAEMGIEEYWIIDPDTQRLTIYKLEDDKYEQSELYYLPVENTEMSEEEKECVAQLYPKEDIITEFTPAYFPELTISLEDIFNFENLDIL